MKRKIELNLDSEEVQNLAKKFKIENHTEFVTEINSLINNNTNGLEEKLKLDFEIPEIFADPTFDVTFKMLFGTETNKDILISLLNSLLGFQGEKVIRRGN